MDFIKNLVSSVTRAFNPQQMIQPTSNTESIYGPANPRTGTISGMGANTILGPANPRTGAIGGLIPRTPISTNYDGGGVGDGGGGGYAGSVQTDTGTGPGGIALGSYPATSLSQDQRQWLWEQFGHTGTAPAGYGGESTQSASEKTEQLLRENTEKAYNEYFG